MVSMRNLSTTLTAAKQDAAKATLAAKPAATAKPADAPAHAAERPAVVPGARDSFVRREVEIGATVSRKGGGAQGAVSKGGEGPLLGQIKTLAGGAFEPTDDKLEGAQFDKAAKGLQSDLQRASDLAAAGDFKQAAGVLKLSLEDSHRVNGEYLTNGDLLGKIKGSKLEEANIKTTIKQLEFADAMKTAGIKDVKIPPTEKQLMEYFGKFKGMKQPDGADQARDALGDYFSAFQVHPVNVKGAPSDVVYSKDDKMYLAGDHATKDRAAASRATKGDTITAFTSAVPDSWSEVVPGKGDRNLVEGRHAGKSVNDCEGYAFMSHKLLGAAGFKTEGFVTVRDARGPDQPMHEMLMMRDPSGNLTLSSNEKILTVENKEKDFEAHVKQWLIEKGYKEASNHQPGGVYIGKTMQESEVAAVFEVAKKKWEAPAAQAK